MMSATHQLFSDLLSRYYRVKVSIDPFAPGLQVPEYLIKDEGIFCLDFGLNLPQPINDLRITDDGILATLSFSGSPFSCYVPWIAVLAFRPDDMDGKQEYPWVPNMESPRFRAVNNLTVEQGEMIGKEIRKAARLGMLGGPEEPTPVKLPKGQRPALRAVREDETPSPDEAPAAPTSNGGESSGERPGEMSGERPRLRLV